MIFDAKKSKTFLVSAKFGCKTYQDSTFNLGCLWIKSRFFFDNSMTQSPDPWTLLDPPPGSFRVKSLDFCRNNALGIRINGKSP